MRHADTDRFFYVVRRKCDTSCGWNFACCLRNLFFFHRFMFISSQLTTLFWSFPAGCTTRAYPPRQRTRERVRFHYSAFRLRERVRLRTWLVIADMSEPLRAKWPLLLERTRATRATRLALCSSGVLFNAAAASMGSKEVLFHETSLAKLLDGGGAVGN